MVTGVALWLFFGFVPPVDAIARAAVVLALGVPSLYAIGALFAAAVLRFGEVDRKSTRLNSSHLVISYAVFCLKKKNAPAQPFPSPSSDFTISRLPQALSSTYAATRGAPRTRRAFSSRASSRTRRRSPHSCTAP